MPDNRPEIKAAWILGGLGIIGVLLTITFSGKTITTPEDKIVISPEISIQQNMTGSGTQIGTNTGTINIGGPEPKAKDSD